MISSASRRHVFGFVAGVVAVPLLPITGRAAQSPVLVELFTSQGCSSCPPADKLAGELAKRDDVIVASFNVDYWDYLGWRDTLAKPEYSKRQYDYARARGDGRVYTPQMVVNGSLHAVGSRIDEVDAAISQARGLSQQVPIRLSISESEVAVTLGAAGGVTDATVWVLGIKPRVDVEIKRGENSGETITYHNVVTHLAPMGMYKGAEGHLALPRKSVLTSGCKSCVAIVQSGDHGPVIGIARQSV
jgi:hypothetical protein